MRRTVSATTGPQEETQMAETKDTLSRIGVYVFPWGKQPPTVESVVRLTRHMEALGLDSVQMPWHFTVPPARFGWGNRYLLDPLVVLRRWSPARAASGSASTPGLCRCPPVRLGPVPGVAGRHVGRAHRRRPRPGWWEEDFVVGGAKLDERGKRSDEALDIVWRLWRGQPIETPGRSGTPAGSPGPPALSPDAAVDRRRREVDRASCSLREGLNPLHPSLEEIRTVLRPGLDAAAARHGRPRLKWRSSTIAW